MLDSAESSKPRDALLEKLKERIKDRDRALEVKHSNPFVHQGHNLKAALFTLPGL